MDNKLLGSDYCKNHKRNTNGELLPTENTTESELCESMHVGRNSVREAIGLWPWACLL